jgi:hypothetical protein
MDRFIRVWVPSTGARTPNKAATVGSALPQPKEPNPVCDRQLVGWRLVRADLIVCSCTGMVALTRD